MADAVIIGAGIQGCSMALAAAERGARPILVEREAVGSGASGNSYGIVHGGLRYLQSLSLDRWRRSRLAQNWYLQRFADLVAPLRCVMPLYHGQFRSPSTFAAARSLDATLSRLLFVPKLLPAGGFFSREDVLECFPVPQRGLVGAAYWYDAELLDPASLLQVMLDKARARGVTVLGHHQVERLMISRRPYPRCGGTGSQQQPASGPCHRYRHRLRRRIGGRVHGVRLPRTA